MTRPVQGMNATTIGNVVSALHPSILGPEAAWAAVTFQTPNTTDPTIIHHEFVQHAGALRFADDADAIATQLKSYTDPDIVNQLINTVPLPEAIERMHDTIRELAMNSSEHIREVEQKAILPLKNALKQLQEADNKAAQTEAWRNLHRTIDDHHIIPFLEETDLYLRLAGDVSQKRRVLFGARPDTGPTTKHFQLVREFIHNISNELLPFILKTQVLKETLSRLSAEAPDEAPRDDGKNDIYTFEGAVADLTQRIDKWYKAYGSGMLTLHRYFIFDGLEKANRQVIMPSVEILARAAATPSPTPLELAQVQLSKQDSHPDPAAPLREQRDQLHMLLENIAGWHAEFDRRSPDTSCVRSQAQLLIENTQQAIVFLSKLTRFFPTGTRGTVNESKVRQFYLYFGKFKAITMAMATSFDGWDSRREAHMKVNH